MRDTPLEPALLAPYRFLVCLEHLAGARLGHLAAARLGHLAGAARSDRLHLVGCLGFLGALLVVAPLASAPDHALAAVVVVFAALAAALAQLPIPAVGTPRAPSFGRHRSDLRPAWLDVDLPRTPARPRAPGRR